MENRCPFCGHATSPTDNFCPQCGNKNTSINACKHLVEKIHEEQRMLTEAFFPRTSGKFTKDLIYLHHIFK